jgi:hypothetical protein
MEYVRTYVSLKKKQEWNHEAAKAMRKKDADFVRHYLVG